MLRAKPSAGAVPSVVGVPSFLEELLRGRPAIVVVARGGERAAVAELQAELPILVAPLRARLHARFHHCIVLRRRARNCGKRREHESMRA